MAVSTPFVAMSVGTALLKHHWANIIIICCMLTWISMIELKSCRLSIQVLLFVTYYRLQLNLFHYFNVSPLIQIMLCLLKLNYHSRFSNISFDPSWCKQCYVYLNYFTANIFPSFHLNTPDADKVMYTYKLVYH